MPAALEPPHPTVAPAFRRSTLRFGDDDLEASFRVVHLRQNVTHVRWAFALGIVLWAVLGVLAQFPGVLEANRGIDAAIRFGFAIPPPPSRSGCRSRDGSSGGGSRSRRPPSCSARWRSSWTGR